MKSKLYLCISGCLFLLMAVSVLTPRGAASEPDDLFPLVCTPFNAPPKHHPVDTQCGPSGDPVTEESSKTDADECDSVTAEMIPHFRPDSWNKITFQAVSAALQKHPVRITGQMFFDASHSPCGHPDHISTDPKRRSNWEIHPLYTIEVC